MSGGSVAGIFMMGINGFGNNDSLVVFKYDWEV